MGALKQVMEEEVRNDDANCFEDSYSFELNKRILRVLLVVTAAVVCRSVHDRQLPAALSPLPLR